MISDFTPYYIANVKPRLSFKFWPSATPLFSIFLTIWALIVIYGAYLIWKAHKSAYGLEKNRLRYVLIATVVGWGGGATNFPLWYDVHLPPFLNILVSAYIIIVGYAIVRHQLMDIEVVIKKTLVFASLFVIVFGIFVGITLLTQQLIAGGRLLGLAISSVIIIFAVRPLEDMIVKTTDRYLFQKKYGYKQIFSAFIDEVITVLSLDEVIRKTIELLEKTLHPETAAVLLLNRYEDKYISYRSSGYGKDIALETKSRIPTLLMAAREIFSVEKPGNPIQATDDLKQEMKGLNARLAIPLLLHADLIGIMLLGKKKSDEEYSQEDLDILTDLARTEAIAIGNAQLFAEAAQNERRAAIGTLAAGINHEVGNPLNIINTKIQVYMMSLEGGYYKDKKPDDIISESTEIMKSCLQQTARISDITKKLSSFAKPSKDFRPELTDIEEQVDETLAVVGHDLELERIEIRKSIEKPLPKILSDRRQVQQIFFNIIKNAGQAIKTKGVIEIRAFDGRDGNVKIEVSDTGAGIPEDKLDKIYEPFYTTKEPGKGTGLGLAIVRQLVWRNKGDIKVRSKVGEGTTFTITFPAAK